MYKRVKTVKFLKLSEITETTYTFNSELLLAHFVWEHGTIAWMAEGFSTEALNPKYLL